MRVTTAAPPDDQRAVEEKLNESVRERKEMERRKPTLLQDRREQEEAAARQARAEGGDHAEFPPVSKPAPSSAPTLELLMKQNNALKQILRVIVLDSSDGGGQNYGARVRTGRRRFDDGVDKLLRGTVSSEAKADWGRGKKKAIKRATTRNIKSRKTGRRGEGWYTEWGRGGGERERLWKILLEVEDESGKW